MLKQILDRNRLRQADVARALGVSRVAVGNWVNGHCIPSGTNLTRLFEYLRGFDASVSYADLVGRERVA